MNRAGARSAGLAEIETLLKSAIGVDAKLIGAAALENAVKRRLTALDIGVSCYPALLHRSGTELQALIDEVVVPETWFFRDREAFSALAALLPCHENRVLRLLSLPCSTGEEPYSIAIALLAAGLQAERFCIDALDISATLLTRAERAIYGRNSFRGEDLAFRDLYFERAETGYHPVEKVRRQVRFAQANLLDPALLAETAPYDAVFCRNVLIYFDRSTQERVLRRLARVIAPDGLLFVGPSEQSLAMSCGFTSLRMAHSSGFRVVGAKAKPAAKAMPETRTTAFPLPTQPANSAKSAAQATFVPPSTTAEPLAKVRQLADAGKFTAAESECAFVLTQYGASAELYYLLGLIRDAANDAAMAMKLYRKALYLDPDHREALQHLSLILHRRHDPSARLLDARLARLHRQDIARQEDRL